MNTYEIEGTLYEAKNEYDAVKQAYKMAYQIVFDDYAGNDGGSETWYYTAIFRGSNGCGHSHVKVRRVHQECDTWVTIRATDPLPEEDRIFAAWYYKIHQWLCFSGGKFRGHPNVIGGGLC